MKALDWHRLLETQREKHGKVLFRVAELANIARRSRHALNVELGRLVKRSVIARYATGIYGLPGGVIPEQLVRILDPGAYITGLYAMHRHNLVTQTPTEITCFTNRRHNLSRQRTTLSGRFVFVCAGPRIYAPPQEASSPIAPPEQSFCDFIHLAVKQGLNPESLVTFRNLSKLNERRLLTTLKRYPSSVASVARHLVSGEAHGNVRDGGVRKR